MDISTNTIEHFGIVAGIFDELGIGKIIDRALPKTRQHKASHSAIIKAISLNGLGFNESRLYFYSNFFIGLPTESLLGEGISPSNLNDDTLSRTLDAIYDYGPTELFNELALQVMNKMAEETHLLHVDTTTSQCLESTKAMLQMEPIQSKLLLAMPKIIEWTLSVSFSEWL